MLKTLILTVARHPSKAISLSMMAYLWSARKRIADPKFPRWWLASRTPIAKRMRYWLFEPWRLHHGADGWLYVRFGKVLRYHPARVILRMRNA